MKTILRIRKSTVLLLCCSALTLTPGASGQTGALSNVCRDRATEDAVPDGLSTGDWTGIRAAYEAGRHAAYPVDGGYQARNPGQQWLTRFDGRGFITEPDAGGWAWGLELQSYGFAGSEQAVTRPARMSAEGGRVAYEWDSRLEEWYVNDTRGLEHGYTVHLRPAQDEERADKPLTLTLSVRGLLTPEVLADGRGIKFQSSGGAAVLTYTGLTVFDADGQELEARFALVGDRLRLWIDERGARYPLTIDPIAQQAYLKASNTGENDEFGWSVGVSGNTAVVGAPYEDSDAGAAYVFVRSGTAWTQQAYLKASNADAGDHFGKAVAVSGDTVVVGALNEGSTATGVDGDQSDNSASEAGAAYVFVRSGTAWNQQAYLKASNTDLGDHFGRSVSVLGDTLVVGAFDEDSNATGVDGDQSDNSASEAGAAYVFLRSGTAWNQQAYLKASNTEGQDRFGVSVSVSVDTAVVGAHGEDSKAGAAYVFDRNGVSWSQQAYLKASNAESLDFFGYTVSASVDTVVVGAHGEDSKAGAAYVFDRNGTSWSQQAYLKASNAQPNDLFGVSVAVSFDVVVVGANGEDSNAVVIDGDQSDNSASEAGAAYVFRRDGTSWSQQAYLKASNTDAGDEFGCSVAMLGDTVVVGAIGEDGVANGVSDAGAAYVFDLDIPPGFGYCFGDPGVGTPCPCGDNDGSVPGSGCDNGVFASGAQLTGSGIASVTADSLVLTTTHLEPTNTGLYFQADNKIAGGDGAQFGDGLRCAGGSLIRLQIRFSDGAGTSSTTIGIAAKGGVSAGETKRYQCWYRTTVNPPCGLHVNDFNLSNGYEVTWRP